MGVSCGYLADPEVGLVFVTSPTCNCLSCVLCCAWGGGRLHCSSGGWGCFSPFTVSVNVYFRLTHVFSVDTLLCITLYIQVADCTIGFLLYLDAYHLP